MTIRLKRAYDQPSEEDGCRVLVERLWPRGLSKARAAVDLWLKDLAPSTELRQWFGHEPGKWPEFQRRYREELEARSADVEQLRLLAAGERVTFVYGSKDTEHNAALVLRDVVEQRPAAEERDAAAA